MNIQLIDIVILVSYLVSVLAIGFYVSRRAGENIDSYFLGGHKIPFYLLGVANATGMFDIAGTMWLVTLFVLYGIKSAFIPWLWPIFNQVFLMIYLATWLRRSGVMTGAEWIRVRFGTSQGATLSHISVVIFAIVGVIGFLAYAFQGVGKFVSVFFPWDFRPHTYALVLMGITTVYVILGGMYSVVITDLIQFLLLTFSAVCVGWIAISRTTAAGIAASTPAGWDNLFFGWKLNLDWSGLLGAGNAQIAADGYDFFTIFIMLVLFKGILASLAGPAPNYDMQRVLATRSPREAALMSWFTSVALFIPRYLLVAGIGVLGIVFFSENLNQMGEQVDFEQVMPYVLNNFIPAGLLGLMLAGLLAAFMSTFDCTVNAGASYVVKDIYQRYIQPNASNSRLVLLSYISSILIVILGVSFGFMTKSINQIVQWIVAGLYGGYIAPNVLKWYWWRFNGYGYFAGMIAGIAAALSFPRLLPALSLRLFPDLTFNFSPLNSFPILLLFSGAVSILVTLMTKPEKMAVLKQFYMDTRPWGFWKPVIRVLQEEHPAFEPNRSFLKDAVNVTVGIVWQLCLCLLPFYLVIRDWKGFWAVAVVLAGTSVFLKINWYNKLENDVVQMKTVPTDSTLPEGR